jgi:hypothetical protein
MACRAFFRLNARHPDAAGARKEIHIGLHMVISVLNENDSNE